MSYTQRASQTQTKANLGPNGEVMCKCSPPKEAVSFQVKNGGSNHGRFFYKCPNAQGKQCKLYLWEDELPDSASTPSHTFPTSSGAGNRLGGSPPSPTLSSQTVRRQPPITPSKPKPSTPTARKRRATEEISDESDSEEVQIVMGSSSAQKDLDEDDEIIVSPTSSQKESPTKKTKFESFTTPKFKSAVVNGDSGASRMSNGRGGEYEKIMGDPASPFHAKQRDLFGNSTPSTSHGSPVSNGQDAVGVIKDLSGIVQSTLEGLQKDVEKKDRLVEAGKKQSASLKERMVKVNAENEGLKAENNALRLQMQKLKQEVDELRTRLSD
ncbi:hypothetical protein P7C70_g7802, partial [Phenoliferia sp. Uapishka_3]